VDDQLEVLNGKVDDLRMDLHSVVNVWEEKWAEERQRCAAFQEPPANAILTNPAI
jgi:hypothetical protein